MLTKEERVYIKSLLGGHQLVFVKAQLDVDKEYLVLGVNSEESELKSIFTSKFKAGTKFKGLKRNTTYIGEVNLRKILN